MTTSTSSDIEAVITRLSTTKSVKGVLVLNLQGVLIRHAGEMFDVPDPHELLLCYVNSALKLVSVSRDAVKGLDLGDEPKFLRLRTKRWEIMVTPDEKYTLVVVQDPSK